jgi:hypothetical protein
MPGLFVTDPYEHQQDLLEGNWDPAKHPRGGSQQNRGWFSKVFGAGGIVRRSLRRRSSAPAGPPTEPRNATPTSSPHQTSGGHTTIQNAPNRPGSAKIKLLQVGDSSSGSSKSITPHPDPARPAWNNGATHIDHAVARVFDGPDTDANKRPLPAETNVRKGGYEGELRRYQQFLVANGLDRTLAREVIQAEIESLAKSPPPRPMNPKVLDTLPGPGKMLALIGVAFAMQSQVANATMAQDIAKILNSKTMKLAMDAARQGNLSTLQNRLIGIALDNNNPSIFEQLLMIDKTLAMAFFAVVQKRLETLKKESAGPKR